MDDLLPILYVAAAIALVVIGVFVYVLHKQHSASDSAKQPTPPQPVDPREEHIDTSAQVVREILMRLTDTIRRVDGATGSSSATLHGIRETLGQMNVAQPLQDAQGTLLSEIDRVISNNSQLQKELDTARRDLAEQEKQITQLKTAVRIDALTAIGNRAAFDERIGEALDRLRRYNEMFSLLMLDVDHFKQINDKHGHVAGDRVLKGLALKLKASIRGSDFLARYGGEEFSVILPNTALKSARDVAEELREAVAYSKFTLDGEALHVTVSTGITESASSDNARTVIERADAALYAAKNAGRNCIRDAMEVECEKGVQKGT